MAACAAISCVSGTIELSTAWTAQTTNPVTAVTATSLGTPTGATATSATIACTSVTISWTSPGGAVNDFKVDKSVDGAAYAAVVATTAGAVSTTDNTGYVNKWIVYRITSLRSGTSWVGASSATTATLKCGVKDLAATNPCSSVVLSWSAANAATTYDVDSSTNGGTTWTSRAVDVAATTYTDNTQYTAAQNVTYRVRPGIGAAGNGAYSITTVQNNWQDFHVASVAVADVLTLGTLKIGDTITITFTKAVDTTTAANASSIDVKSTAPRTLYLGWNGASGDIGSIATPNIWGATAAYAGGASSAWSGGNTVYTWVSGVAGTTMSAALSGVFTAGTVKCASDSTGLKTATAPTLSGRW